MIGPHKSNLFHRSKKDSNLDKRDISTRQFDKIKFKVLNPVVKKAFTCPNCLGANIWDILPVETQTEPMINAFKYKAV